LPGKKGRQEDERQKPGRWGMGNGMADLLLRGWMKTERGVGQRVLLFSQKGVIRGERLTG